MTDTTRDAVAAEPAAPAGRKADSRWRRLAELFALTGFAIAQPLLDVTGRSPDFFLFRRPSIGEMWALVALVVLLPPLALWATEVVAGLAGRTAERVVHLTYAAGLLAIVVVQIGKQNDFYGRRLAAVAFVVGIGLAVLLARSAGLRQALAYMAPAPLAFVLVFALTAESGVLMRPARAGSAAEAATGADHPPVVVLTFDEFPTRALLDAKGDIDATLFPNFAALAKQANWYPNGTGMSGYTPYAVPTILTGLAPRKRLAPSYVEYPDNLFTLLGKRYSINAFESISQLCPPRYCAEVVAGRSTGLKPLIGDTLDIALEIVSPRRPKVHEGENFAEQVDANPSPAKGELAPGFRLDEGKKNQPDRMTAFLDSIGRRADKPTLDFLHILLPHIPWRYLPSGRTYAEHGPAFPLGRAKEGDKFRRNEEPGALTVAKQRMLLQVVYTDALVGQLVERMKSAGTWDKAVLVITADHGAGLTPGQKSRLLDTDNPAELAYVPMFVKLPGQRAGKTDERNAMNIDLLPTVADALDVKLPFKVDGVSLLGPPRPSLDKQWYDNPGEAQPIDGARWTARVRSGLAPEIARPEVGPEGLFAAGPLKALVGRQVADLTVAAPSPAKARTGVSFEVDTASGKVPALLWGDLTPAPADRSTWLAVAVNGVVSGAVVAAPSRADGSWHFVGIVTDKHFTGGPNDVRLYAVDGTTLHPVAWG